MGLTATAADYLWFQKLFPDLAEAYCLTLVHNLPPSEVLARLGGRVEPSRTGAAEIVDAAFELLDRSDSTRQFIAMTTVGDWTLLIEPIGYLGVTEERALPASAGTRWVSHFVNINGVDSFLWADDTVKRLTFEPEIPDHRWGTTPDDLLDAMRHCGFQFGDEISDTADFLGVEASFALAEHLTGVRVTPELLRETTFVCGSAGIG
ncbi:DUF6461 domain-containing protein [Streptomyces turgidiscabies]|uniref:DUF6461 domain-containing protein n=1 Tax=Streptomyces turgidiscabies TaxID=85558 RepID=UPI0002E89021|nr:DUF6461 domain-containing protein [Streptomyces turgidiscabies]GAQ69761.1 hypothetical protein T45_01492 [Streptomyces turgidiscabies]